MDSILRRVLVREFSTGVNFSFVGYIGVQGGYIQCN